MWHPGIAELTEITAQAGGDNSDQMVIDRSTEISLGSNDRFHGQSRSGEFAVRPHWSVEGTSGDDWTAGRGERKAHQTLYCVQRRGAPAMDEVRRWKLDMSFGRRGAIEQNLGQPDACDPVTDRMVHLDQQRLSMAGEPIDQVHLPKRAVARQRGLVDTCA